MVLIIKGDMASICKKCKSQGGLTDNTFHNIKHLDYLCEGDDPTACPIVGELPDNHGRIVDLDRVLNWLINEDGRFSMGMSAKIDNALKNAPVILEATK